jgi:hypothetical protein
MRMSDDLQSFMGFEDLPDCQKSFVAVGERNFDANRGLIFMYVYCDVATHSIVGEPKLPSYASATSRAGTGSTCGTPTSSPTTCPWGGTNSTRSRLPYIATQVNPCRFSTANRRSPYTFDADMCNVSLPNPTPRDSSYLIYRLTSETPHATRWALLWVRNFRGFAGKLLPRSRGEVDDRPRWLRKHCIRRAVDLITIHLHRFAN